MAIIIGDTHGNLDKVKAFLAFKPKALHIALGDYLDSFTEPPVRQLEALQLLIESDAVLLWGNHDLHYLKVPPFICTGFQRGREKQYQEVIETNKNRFLAAYVVDGWLCTHAGVNIRIAQHKHDIIAIAGSVNESFARWLKDQICFMHPKNGWMSADTPDIFHIGIPRGGDHRYGGPFWYDFTLEDGLAKEIRQIFGHTETNEPVVTDTYVALDTSNCTNTCYLYDTETSEVVKLNLP